MDAGNELTQGREHASGAHEVKEEMAELKERLSWVTAAANERQKELESTWSTVKHFQETVTPLIVQITQKMQDVHVLMRPGADPSDVAAQMKVRPVSFLKRKKNRLSCC